MKTRVSTLLIALLIGTLLYRGTPFGFAQQRQAINLSAAKGLPFSDGIIAGNTLYVAGQQGRDAAGDLPSGGIGPETELTLEAVAKVVKAAGFELKDIVAVNVYLTDINDFAEMNKVYRVFLPDPKPTRTTVQVSGLVSNAHIEISVVAVKQK